MEDVHVSQTHALECGHRYCLDCWKGHLSTVVSSYGTQILWKTKCIFPTCYVVVNRDHFAQLADPYSLGRYQYFLSKSFVEGNKRTFTFCPNDCGNIIK